MKCSLMLMFTLIILVLSQNEGFSQTKAMSKDELLVEKIKCEPLNGFFGITFTNSVPQGEFQDNVQKSGQGFSLYGGYQANPLPIAVGLEGDILFYGGETRTFTYTRQGGWRAFDTVTAQNMVVPIDAFIRLQPSITEFPYIIPYLEGFLGMTLISASADYKPQWGSKDSKSEFRVVFNYGASAGLMFKVFDYIEPPTGHFSIYIDIKGKYLSGAAADYFMVKQINPDSSPDFKSYSSKTDLFLLLAGLTFRF